VSSPNIKTSCERHTRVARTNRRLQKDAGEKSNALGYAISPHLVVVIISSTTARVERTGSNGQLLERYWVTV